jgi:hypothetical protein
LAELLSTLNLRIARLAARVEQLEDGTRIPSAPDGRDRLARRRLALMGDSTSPVLRYLAGRERVLGDAR